jgi:small subunit ribosomal protein S20
MPNIQSAKKRLRRSERQRAVNAPIKTRVRTTRRKFIEVLESDSAEARAAAYSTYCSCLDKAAKSGVIERNTAIRRKARAAARLRKLAAAADA